jgi:beta-D-galactosyl-(1->4)-L-rhamnose phosphorylase
MAHVLGIDEDKGARVCHGRWSYDVEITENLLPQNCFVSNQKKLYLTDGQAKVYMEDNHQPTYTINSFGKGFGIYLASFELTPVNTRMLFNLICHAGGEEDQMKYVTDNSYMECAYYPESKTLVVINNSDCLQTTTIYTDFGPITATLEAFDYLKRNFA